jgi:hypothetical protein
MIPRCVHSPYLISLYLTIQYLCTDKYRCTIMHMIIQMNKLMKNTLMESCIANVNESRSSLAATIRQGTS